MSTLNVFESIRNTTHRTEPFHSQFLTDALKTSLSEGRKLFDKFWELATPCGWLPPINPDVVSEEILSDRKRIDICVVDKDLRRVLGIEVKTVTSSARKGQLRDYACRLEQKYDSYELAIAYLTPFNRQRAGEYADNLQTVREFDEFRNGFEKARHLSWLDIAEIEWSGSEIWRQHQSYVKKRITSRKQFESVVMRTSRDRLFNKFFEPGAAEEFWLELSGIEMSEAARGARINLAESNLSPEKLVEALETLIKSEDPVDWRSNRDDKFPKELRAKFLNSEFISYHEAIFSMARRFQHVWLQGKGNYGLRVAHRRHSGGVSLVCSDSPQFLDIGRPR